VALREDFSFLFPASLACCPDFSARSIFTNDDAGDDSDLFGWDADFNLPDSQCPEKNQLPSEENDNAVVLEDEQDFEKADMLNHCARKVESRIGASDRDLGISPVSRMSSLSFCSPIKLLI
jgi:hypothetical protein